MKFIHVNLIALDVEKIVDFYVNVFDCQRNNQKRDLSGEWIDKITGIKDVHITGEHLILPTKSDYQPTLEIFAYNTMVDLGLCTINQTGFSHIAFEVEDVYTTLERAIIYGGCALGEVIEQEYDNNRIGTFVYLRDPEGNIVELQSWQEKTSN